VSQWDIPMEIKGTSQVGTSAIKRKTSASAAGSGFAVSEAAESQGQQIVAGPGPIAALDSILMLQGLDDSTQGKSKGLAHGEQLLDLLDILRLHPAAESEHHLTVCRSLNSEHKSSGRRRYGALNLIARGLADDEPPSRKAIWCPVLRHWTERAGHRSTVRCFDNWRKSEQNNACVLREEMADEQREDLVQAIVYPTKPKPTRAFKIHCRLVATQMHCDQALVEA